MNTQTIPQALALAASYAEALVTFNECAIRCERDPLNKRRMAEKVEAYDRLCDAQDALNFEAQKIAMLNLS